MKNKKIILIASGVLAIVLIIAIAFIFVTISNRPTAKANSVYSGTAYLVSHRSSGTALQDLTDVYGFSTETAESVINRPDEWKAYKLEVEVNNKSKDSISVNAFKVKDNGKDEVWVSTVAEPRVDIIGGNTEIISIFALVRSSITAEDAAKAIQAYKIKVVYSATPTISKDGKQSIETSKIISVK